jgi:hypothetical protein
MVIDVLHCVDLGFAQRWIEASSLIHLSGSVRHIPKPNTNTYDCLFFVTSAKLCTNNSNEQLFDLVPESCSVKTTGCCLHVGL